MQQWEYFGISVPQTPREYHVKLNEYGADGWELIAFDGTLYVFKRPLN